MSTRASRAYLHRGPFEFHWYHEFIDSNDHAELRLGRSTVLNVVVWRGLRYWHRPRWFGDLMCWVGKHDWFLHEMSQRGSQRRDGRYNLTGRWSYKCQKCGVIRIDHDDGPPYTAEYNGTVTTTETRRLT